jgi:hypothetical protein
MTTCNSEGVAEFIRLVGELSDFTEDMSDYEVRFMFDSNERIERYGDKVYVTETQLDFVRNLYKRIL